MSHIIALFILGFTILAILCRPFIGVIAYYILSFLRPQDMLWGFYDMRLSMWVGLATGVSLLMHFIVKKEKGLVRAPQIYLLLGLLLTMVIAHISVLFRDLGVIQHISGYILDKNAKMIVFCILAAGLINSYKRFRMTVWALVVSVCYLAVRGNYQYFFLGYPQIVGPGFGSGGYTFLDRNIFAMLFVVILPFVYFLFFTEKSKLLKILLIGQIPILIHAIILTYSRGGFVGMVPVLGLSVWRTKNKMIALVAALACFLAITSLQGAQSLQRMQTILHYEEDASASRRIEAWKAGFQMMKYYPFTGVGLGAFEYVSRFYNPEAGSRVAHNAFIQLGAEAGIPAMVFYILLILFCLYHLRRIRRLAKKKDKNLFIYNYSAMLEASFAGFIICGMFLSLDLFEFYYVLVALTVALRQIAIKEKIITLNKALDYRQRHLDDGKTTTR